MFVKPSTPNVRLLTKLPLWLFAAGSLGCATTPNTLASRARLERIELATGSFGPPGAMDTPHRTVQVAIAGKERTLLLDSGGGLTLISPRVAADLGCQPHGRFTAHRMTTNASTCRCATT